MSYKGLFPEDRAKFWPSVSLVAYCDAKALDIEPALSWVWANLGDCFKKDASWDNLPDSSKIHLFLSANLPKNELIAYCRYKKNETWKQTNYQNYHLENGRWSIMAPFHFKIANYGDLRNISTPLNQISDQQTTDWNTSHFNNRPIEWDQPTIQNQSGSLYMQYKSKQLMPHTTSNYSNNSQNINNPNYKSPSNPLPNFSELVHSLQSHPTNEGYSGYLPAYSKTPIPVYLKSELPSCNKTAFMDFSDPVKSMGSEQADYARYPVEPMVSEQIDYAQGYVDTSLKYPYTEELDSFYYDEAVNNPFLNAETSTTDFIPQKNYQKTFSGQTFFEPSATPLKWEEPLEELYPNLMDPYYYNNN